MVSASGGIPGRPSFRDVAPSRMAPCSGGMGAKAWSMMGIFSLHAISIACFINLSLATVFPSSLKAIAPAFAISLRSASSLPRRFFVMQAAGRILARAFSVLYFNIALTLSGVSIGGMVLGMTMTVVNPPLAAAVAPDFIVSASSLPGWRKWTWMSIKPGARTRPSALIRGVDSGHWDGSEIRPFFTYRSAISSLPISGSIILPPIIYQELFMGIKGYH